MIGLEFLRHGNRFAARIRRRYFSAERISTAGNTSAFAGYDSNGLFKLIHERAFDVR